MFSVPPGNGQVRVGAFVGLDSVDLDAVVKLNSYMCLHHTDDA